MKRINLEKLEIILKRTDDMLSKFFSSDSFKNNNIDISYMNQTFTFDKFQLQYCIRKSPRNIDGYNYVPFGNGIPRIDIMYKQTVYYKYTERLNYEYVMTNALNIEDLIYNINFYYADLRRENSFFDKYHEFFDQYSSYMIIHLMIQYCIFTKQYVNLKDFHFTFTLNWLLEDYLMGN